jgi:hypothetical protein
MANVTWAEFIVLLLAGAGPKDRELSLKLSGGHTILKKDMKKMIITHWSLNFALRSSVGFLEMQSRIAPSPP